MYIIDEKDFVLIPLAYNDFCDDVMAISETGVFAGTISTKRILSVQSVKRVYNYIEKQDRNSEIYYVIDFRNIISYAERIFGCFSELPHSHIIFYGLNSDLKSKLEEDLSGIIFPFQGQTLGMDKNSEKFLDSNKAKIENIYRNEASRIIRWMACTIRKNEPLIPLDSSGIFCNMYVNIKRLFLDPDKYYFIVYLMILEIIQYKNNIDALISASRNGANLANIIGWLLDIKVVHCINLGPKFSLSIKNVNKDIRKRKKYFYIFDFMCLGTEAKVLNAILMIKDARLVGGMGIANYVPFNSPVAEKSVIGKMKTIMDTREAELEYKIAGTKEEIARMLIERESTDESRMDKV